MDSSINCIGDVSGFYDVDFAGSGPAAVFPIGREHPEGGPDTLGGRELDSCLDSAVKEVLLCEGAEASGGVIASLVRFVASDYYQIAIADVRVFRAGCVVLELVVSPAGGQTIGGAVAELVRPIFIVYTRAIELI